MGKTDKAAPMTAGAKFLMVSSILGGILLLTSILPFVPWRFAERNSFMGSRFGSWRKYTLFSAGDQFGQPASWMKLKREVCQKMLEFNQPNPMNALLGSTAALGTGGALMGCQAWPQCKAHVAARCAAYGTMAILGILVAVLNLVGAILAFVVPIMLNCEPAEGKKKKQKVLEQIESHRMYTAVLCAVACALPFIASLVWVTVSSATIRGLQTTGFYPYAGAAAGCYLPFVACFLLFVGAAVALRRYTAFGKEDKEPAEEVAVYDGAGVDEMPPPEDDLLMPGFSLPPPPGPPPPP